MYTGIVVGGFSVQYFGTMVWVGGWLDGWMAVNQLVYSGSNAGQQLKKEKYNKIKFPGSGPGPNFESLK